MKYTTPLYECINVDTVDIICASSKVSTYTDKDGNVVEEHDFSFSSLFNK